MADAKKRQQQEDSQLRAELGSYGETVGPISSAVVRGIYQSKLKKLKSGSTTKAPPPAAAPKRRSSPARSTRAVAAKGNAADDASKGPDTLTTTTTKVSQPIAPEKKSPAPKRSSITSRTRRSTAGVTSVKFSSNAKSGDGNPDAGQAAPLPVSNNDACRNGDPLLPADRRQSFGRHVREMTRRSLKSLDDSTLDGNHSQSTRRSNVSIEKRWTQSRSEFSDEDDVLSRHCPASQSYSESDLYSSKRPSHNSSRSHSLRSSTPQSKYDSVDANPLARYRRSDGDMDEELTPQFLRPHDLIVDFLSNRYTIFFASVAAAVFLVWLLMLWKIPTMLPMANETPDSATVVKDPAYQDGIAYLRCIYKELSERKGLASCGASDVQTRFNSNEMVAFVRQCTDVDQEVNARDIVLNGLKAAMLEYPKQFVVTRHGHSVNKLFDLTPLDASLHLTTDNIAKPLLCRFRQSMSIVLVRVLIAAIVVVFGICVYLFVKRRWMIDDEETRLMFMLVEKIIDALRQHHDACQQDKSLPPYLPIPHVRDLLISPSQRKAMNRVWNKAVHFLSSTDSRIRVETQLISGEEFDVWRWIGIPTIKPVKSANHLSQETATEKSKTWQGPAFDEIEKVVRLPIVTPTPCLKIRFMHNGTEETEDKWDLRVRDALLEKCTTDGAKVLHIFVDKKSSEGCVYLKCDSLDSAGKAFRSIYGNWFDGRLVIVKFVTLTRYHQRFPEAFSANQELYASRLFPSSISNQSKNP